jgi:hypothetical protein
MLGPECEKLHIFKSSLKYAACDTTQYQIWHRSKISNIAKFWFALKKYLYMYDIRLLGVQGGYFKARKI